MNERTQLLFTINSYTQSNRTVIVLLTGPQSYVLDAHLEANIDSKLTDYSYDPAIIDTSHLSSSNKAIFLERGNSELRNANARLKNSTRNMSVLTIAAKASQWA